MSDDETFRNMPSLAPSDPPSRSDEIDHQFRHLSYKLDELNTKLDNLDNRLDDLDTTLTDKLEDLDQKISGKMIVLCIVTAGILWLVLRRL